MSFYHILPSNSSPTYFPKNNASQYSTPIENSYDLSGSWEVALLNITYSNCIKTFNNDRMMVNGINDIKTCLTTATKPIKVMISMPQKGEPHDVIAEIVKDINHKFQDLLSLQVLEDKIHIQWNILVDNAFIIISHTLQKNIFSLWHGVMTNYSYYKRNYKAVGGDKYKYPTDPNELFIIWVPTSYNKKQTFVVKGANEVPDTNRVCQNFNSQIPQDVAVMSLKGNGRHFQVEKLANDNYAIVYSKDFLKALTFRHSGVYYRDKQRFYACDFQNGFRPEWSVSLYTLDEIITYSPQLPKEVILPPISIKNRSEAIAYVNRHINDTRISFSCDSEHYVQLRITDKSIGITLDDTLRDIFGFDKNSYEGVGLQTAPGIFSLTRCIQYFFIYSSISEYVRIGDTEAPLLGVIPFNANKSCTLLEEKVFKMPMYVHVQQNHISQIDIGIYDGAGELVPFIDDAVTTLRLHFRQAI